MSLSKYTITEGNVLSDMLLSNGIHDLESLARYLKTLPYGRNANKTDLSLILTEGMGTCSSKHAFFKAVAMENNFEDIKLVLSIFKMNGKNTPGIGNLILKANLDHIPEAHCYLKIENQVYDLTHPSSSFEKIKDDVMHEQFILPDNIGQYKIDFHKAYISRWISENGILLTSQDIWRLREECIKALSQQTPDMGT